MIGAFVANAWLAPGSSFYAAIFLAQCAFYAAALAGSLTGAAALKIPTFFVVANLGVFTAWLRYARGERIATWNPSERVSALPSVGPVEPPPVVSRSRQHVPVTVARQAGGHVGNELFQ
jgi:hypothetical protein